MGILDKLRGEFIDIIEWTQPNDSDILAYRFPRYNNEIKMGAKLTVREGQAAVFVNEGRLADVFQPGMYELQTSNMPILSTLMGWKYGFNSPFKAEVYFVVTTQQTGHKWGTQNPIMMRDADFGMVRLRAFGSYVFRVSDPGNFIRELVSTDPSFEDYEIDSQLRQVIVTKFADVIGKSKIPVLDLVGNYQALSEFVLENIRPDFASWGLELTKFYIENISVPPAVEEALDRRTQMGIIGDLSQYTKFQTAEAIRAAAENPAGGAAGAGVGLGAGLGMANQMMSAFQAQTPAQTAQPVTPAVPPPLPQAIQVFVALDGQQAGPFDLTTLSGLAQQGRLTKETLVWKQGLANWIPASSLPEIASVFGATPPPLPPTDK